MKAKSSRARHESHLVVNGRFRAHRITGVQRYAHEIVSRLQGEMTVCTPRAGIGAMGHAWEQTVLPLACRGRTLWSPCGSGPIGYGRQVVTFHDLFPIEHPEWYGKAYSAWYGVTMRQLATRATHLIAVSEYTKARIVKLLHRDPEDITVIPNGCSIKGRASEGQIEAARHALNLPTRRYVLSLSSIEARKNIRSILQAWSTIQEYIPRDIWLVLAGPKANEKVFGSQEVEATLPRVLFTGYVPEEHLAGLYSGASLFVFPSLAEGFGLPLLEAMASGVRCITSKTTSLPEVGGDVVDYVDPLQPAEIARAMMMRLMGDACSTMPYEPAMARAGLFTWKQAASRTDDVIAATLAARANVVPVFAGTMAGQ